MKAKATELADWMADPARPGLFADWHECYDIAEALLNLPVALRARLVGADFLLDGALLDQAAAELEVQRLRDGIQALADEWEQRGETYVASDLRALLDPTPTPKEES